jgi:hypothetical protein
MATITQGVSTRKISWAELKKIKGDKDKPEAPKKKAGEVKSAPAKR